MKTRFDVGYSKVPIIRTVRRASSAVHAMYCYVTGICTGTYNRHFRVVTFTNAVVYFVNKI